MIKFALSAVAESHGFAKKAVSKAAVGVLCSLAVMSAPLVAHAGSVGVDFTSASNVGFNGNTWTLGYQFKANTNTSVVGLGTWNSGITGRVEVGLWDSAGTLLASTFVTAADTQLGTANWVFKSIGPVALTAGSNYFVGSYGDTNYAFDANGFTTNSAITYVSDAWSLGGFSFPTKSSGFVGTSGRNGFFGGNVELANTVPEPGVIALMGLGLAGIAATRRRRNGK